MKRSVFLWQLMGFAFTSLGGTLLHFLYDRTGGAIFIAPFSGVNESTFEHMKLLFWPMLLFAVIERLFLSDLEGFWCVKLRGILLGLVLIPVIFYTYNGVIGKSPDWINIAIFFVCAAIAYLYEACKMLREPPRCHHPIRAISTLGVIAILFVVFTFFTPEIGIFQDPITKAYGI